MSRGYSATPLWGLSRNSAVAGINYDLNLETTEFHSWGHGS